MSEVSVVRQINVRGTFASLKYPNYRLWFIGQLVSLVGTWTQTAAQGYLIYQLTKSPAYLGYVSFASGLPSWIFTLYAGAIADRVSRRTLMVITQASMMILAFILAFLTFTNLVQPWHIIVLSFLLGISNAFDAPARQAFVLEMVDREDMTNAIALNSTMFNLAFVVGPALGGLIYAAVGPGWCFVINGISFIAVIIALLLMKLKPFIPIDTTKSAISDMKEGLKYVVNHSAVRMLITNLFITTLFGLGITALIPAWSTTVLNGDAKTNGFLLAARGFGSLVAALMIAALGRFRWRGKLWLANSLLLPISMILFALLTWLIPSLVAMAAMGFAFMVIVNLSNAMVQTRIADEMRGRVMGVYTFFFFGAIPIGSLLAGWSAEVIGEPRTVIIAAIILLLFALWVLWRQPAMRQME
ncbi:MAG: MFS transporter [Anaerolineales bacterium]|nr:MFS transporter [Anaerolineae bacterium]PWB56395.1 MAG: MFS transporter [Anaerolineales bacterium]